MAFDRVLHELHDRLEDPPRVVHMAGRLGRGFTQLRDESPELGGPERAEFAKGGTAAEQPARTNGIYPRAEGQDPVTFVGTTGATRRPGRAGSLGRARSRG